MKALRFTLFVVGLVLVFTSSALAYTLTEDFTLVNSINMANLSTSSGLNQWNDLVRWQINTSGGNLGNWAQQTPNATSRATDETSLLYYGFDATGLGTGTTFSLDFDFLNDDIQGYNRDRDGTVYIGGLKAGDTISRWAPWGDLGTTNFDSASIAKDTSNWTAMSTFSGIVDDDYDVLYIAFKMGGYDGLRGIDNVNLQVGTPVPEPTTMLLFGTGIAGLIGLRRKK